MCEACSVVYVHSVSGCHQREEAKQVFQVLKVNSLIFPYGDTVAS